MPEILVGIGGYWNFAQSRRHPRDDGLGVVCCDCGARSIDRGDRPWPMSALPGNPRDKKRSQPRGYYADSAVPELIRKLEVAGGPRRGIGLRIKIVGGATILDAMGSFNIGKRNVLAIKRALWRFGLGPLAEDVGGNFSRTVRIEVGETSMRVSSPGRPDWRV